MELFVRNSLNLLTGVLCNPVQSRQQLNINFQATTFQYPPRTIATKDDSGKDVVTGGYEFLIFDAIARKHKLVEIILNRVL